jgi:hypothetical protein
LRFSVDRLQKINIIYVDIAFLGKGAVMEDNSKGREYEAIVLSVDALGVSNNVFDKDLSDEAKFERAKDFAIKFNEIVEEHSNTLELCSLMPEFSKGAQFELPKIKTVGDNILLIFETKSNISNIEFTLALTVAVSFANALIIKGLPIKIYFRGAIAYGKVFEINNTLVGSAIFESIKCGDVTDWLGVITSPNLYKKCKDEKIVHTWNKHFRYISNTFLIKYNPPIKQKSKCKNFCSDNRYCIETNNKEELYCVHWPILAFKAIFKNTTQTTGSESVNAKGIYARILQLLEGVEETKKQNTIKFLNETSKRTQRYITKRKQMYHSPNHSLDH